MRNKYIYLDNAASTPVDPSVMKNMSPYFGLKFGNPMSIHSMGQEALEATEESRQSLADFFQCAPEEILFTSGSTEANNLAIKGTVMHCLEKKMISGKLPHIITTAFEHHCVLESCEYLEKNCLAEVTYIKPDANGIIDIKSIEKYLRPETILVSVMYVNNEIGTVQPIKEIGEMLRKYNSSRRKKCPSVVFHTDGTQAVNYFDCRVDKLGVDLFSLSAHKIYGPKGAGALYVRKGTPIARILDGGSQENGMRAGTHNVPGIVGLGKAIELIANSSSKKKARVAGLRDRLIEGIMNSIPDAKLNGSRVFRSPANVNFSFKNIEGESLILALDAEGIACSTGSACSSGNLDPSHVLLSIGLTPEEAHGSVRFSLGKNTTAKEIEKTIKLTKAVVKRLRDISGNVLDEFYQK
jgi:cysteine desulfurase